MRRRIPPVEFSLGKPPQELLRFAPRTSSEWTAAAAREAGRAIGTTPDAATGMSRANRAAQLAVEDPSVAASDVRVAYAAAGVDCATRVASRRGWRRGRSSPSASP